MRRDRRGSCHAEEVVSQARAWPLGPLFVQVSTTGLRAEAYDVLERFHYLGRPVVALAGLRCTVTLHKPGGLFGAAGETVGCALYRESQATQASGWLELSRLAVAPGLTVTLTAFLAASLRALKSIDRKTVIVVSYAAQEEGHHGGIYQAASWHYGGPRVGRKVIVNGTAVPRRSASSLLGSTAGLPQIYLRRYLYWKPIRRRGRHLARAAGLESLPYPKPDLTAPHRTEEP